MSVVFIAFCFSMAEKNILGVFWQIICTKTLIYHIVSVYVCLLLGSSFSFQFFLVSFFYSLTLNKPHFIQVEAFATI